ncbi:hypothetical protein LWI28_001056 [Acer negundo]|uniref:Trichome birefringence-like N-terminal domain-containing protein n=1 Tax=Acer negundo TaxID=4023 RepID=A0AAD5NEN4_ACENE|nr:hypothetical protein LWI28_001056 [Acer negundo]
MNLHAMLADQNSKIIQEHQVQKQKTPLHCFYCDQDHHNIERCYYLHDFLVGNKLHGNNMKPHNHCHSNANNVNMETNKALETKAKPVSADDGPRLTIKEYNKPMAMIRKNNDGEWVPNPEGPYYTNTTCWAIYEHQNCMKFGRPDTDFMKWRWKPDGCDLPIFNPAQFLEIVRGKSLAFIGDSVARNQMQSLICLLG